jgi:hypothetical protein
MGGETGLAPSDPCEGLLRRVSDLLATLRSEIAALRDAKAAAEADLAAARRKAEEQAAQIAGLKRRLAQAEAEAPVIASAHRKNFHRMTCKYATDIDKSDHPKRYPSRQQAIDAGYKPCRTCCS